MSREGLRGGVRAEVVTARSGVSGRDVLFDISSRAQHETKVLIKQPIFAEGSRVMAQR